MPIEGGVGAAQVFSSASGGKVYAFNSLTTTPSPLVAPANPSRTKVRFHNPGAVDIYVYPQFVLNASGQNVALSPGVGSPGGCFLIFANGGTLDVSGECQGQWGAFAASGTGSLTVMDTNWSG